MKLDTHILATSVGLIGALMFLLLPLYGDFGELTAGQTTTGVVVSVLAAFVLGKRVGETRHG